MNTLFREQRLGRIIADLSALIYSNLQPVALDAAPGFYASPSEADGAVFAPFGDQETWGGRNSYTWFRGLTAAPVCGQDERPVLLVDTVDAEGVETARMQSYVTGTESRWDLMNPQFMLFLNGSLVQGLDVHHRCASLPTGAAKVDLQGYAGMTDRRFSLHVYTAICHEDVQAVYYDLRTALEAAQTLEASDPHRPAILAALNDAANLLDLRHPYSAAFREGVAQARAQLASRVYCGTDSPVEDVAVGHTHIDVAWLWDHCQTRQKVRRSFSGMLRLFERYDAFTFFQSTPQLFRWLEKDDPSLLEALSQRIAQGRMEVDGGLWLEADCNIPSGESLMRQVLYGKRYFKERFGTDCEVLWLPDVFGYSAALPQILKLAGINTFVTTKISWNMLNRMPYDTFRWQGIDGSSVLAYFITTTEPKQEDGGFGTTYNGVLCPSSVMGGWKRYEPKEINRTILMAYGYGDGGGGPDEEMLEMGLRMQRGIPGFPKVTLGHVRPGCEKLAQRLQGTPYLPVWNGELYLELHQGAYTSCAWIKRNNRIAERELGAAEWLQTAAMLRGMAYDAQTLSQAWETLLLNQFHDTLPGSCIGKVYEDAKEQFSSIYAATDRLIAQAGDYLWGRGTQELVYNDLPFARSDTVLLPHGKAVAGQPWQTTQEGNLCLVSDVPALGWRTIETCDAPDAPAEARADQALETSFVRIELDGTGAFTRLYDKRLKRELLLPGARGNRLMAFEDRPASWDSWNIDMYYEEHAYDVDGDTTVSPVTGGALYESVTVVKRFGRSVFTQEIRAWHAEPRVDFITHVDWREDATVLKTAFPLAINTDFATFDIQCGSLRRPTHRNTSWDAAKYEVCAQRWADLSEGDCGVSLLNDCKYGHDAQGSVLRLTLLKAGMAPDEKVDRGEHRFTYALYLHEGPCGAQTDRMAARLNHPLRLTCAAAPQEAYSLMSCDNPNVTIDAVKRSEAGDHSIIVHLHELGNTHANTRLQLGFPVEKCALCTLMEEETAPAATDGKSVSLSFHPFEIKILRLWPARDTEVAQ